MIYSLFAASVRRLLFVPVWCLLASNVTYAQFGLVTREEALAAVFPNAVVTAERVFLTDTQVNRISELLSDELRIKLYARYIATRNNTVVGRAYIDTHRVRTKNQSLLVSLDVGGRVQRIDVTAFLEPQEYIAGSSWMNQFNDKPLDEELMIQRSIRPIAGATLTAHAVNAAVRRVMAIDQVLTAEMETMP